MYVCSFLQLHFKEHIFVSADYRSTELKIVEKIIISKTEFCKRPFKYSTKILYFAYFYEYGSWNSHHLLDKILNNHYLLLMSLKISNL